MSYNISFVNNATNIGDLVSGVTSFGNGEVYAVLLSIIYVSLFAAFKNYDTVVSFIITGFITSIIAGIFWWLSWIGWHIAIIPMILFVIAIIVHSFR